MVYIRILEAHHGQLMSWKLISSSWKLITATSYSLLFKFELRNSATISSAGGTDRARPDENVVLGEHPLGRGGSGEIGDACSEAL